MDRHRRIASVLLSGKGVEIGALHNKFYVPQNCAMSYFDVDTASNLMMKFPELKDIATITEPDYIGDVEKDSLIEITKTKFDFIIANHVIEHISNPIKFVKNIWDALNDDGCFVLSAPDKDFTFDKPRNLTTFEHLKTDYDNDISFVDDEHYIDFLKHVHPDISISSELIMSVRNRREHVHVWNSRSFAQQLRLILELLKFKYNIIFESFGEDNSIEYFCLIQKGDKRISEQEIALKLLLEVYATRNDLRSAFKQMKELLGWVINCGCITDGDSYILRDYLGIYRELYANNGYFKIDCLQLKS